MAPLYITLPCYLITSCAVGHKLLPSITEMRGEEYFLIPKIVHDCIQTTRVKLTYSRGSS